MSQPPDDSPPQPDPASPYGGPTPPSGNRASLLAVIALLGVLALVAAAVGVYALVSSGDDGPSGSSPRAVTPSDDTFSVPTSSPDLSPDSSDSPTTFLTELPSDFPTDGLTDFPSLPTDGGPDEEEYVDVATAIVAAARAGDCRGARRYVDDVFGSVVTDADLCKGLVRDALEDDDLGASEITFFGAYGAAVQFDGGRTYVSLVAQSDGPPLVNALIAY